ncbi:Little elongation complex subunit 1 [Frankliniella fusca]|uniref:Little elongation complex subunit 1 n=1 Tax=Frankliniella fusca TaxID=407009 RepID=A0AAE1HD79_9NEOP|nr:Little elongation complex subunit 1 [Frankliniella fusca]
MDWRESINCQNCIILNKKLELFDLLKQKCCRNDDIAKNLLSLKKAYEKSTKVLESKSKKLVEVRRKLDEARKNEEILKRKVAEFQLRLVSSDTKYQEVVKDIEIERDRCISLSKAKSQLEDLLQMKENEMASMIVICKQSEERHSNETQNFKLELVKRQEAAKVSKKFYQSHKKLEKLENQLNKIFEDGFDLSKDNHTKLKRIVSRINSTATARKLEAELNSPSMTPDGTPSLDTGIFSGDEDFENPTLAGDLLMSSESSDDDFEDVEDIRKQKMSSLSTDNKGVQIAEGSHQLLQLPRLPNSDTSSSVDSFDDGETTLCPSNDDLFCDNNESNLKSYVCSPSGHSTQVLDPEVTDGIPSEQRCNQNTKVHPEMESSSELPDLCLSELPPNIDLSVKIDNSSSIQNVKLSQRLQVSSPHRSDVLASGDISSDESKNIFHEDFDNSVSNPLQPPASTKVDHDAECYDPTQEIRESEMRNVLSPMGSPSQEPDSSLLSEQLPLNFINNSEKREVSKDCSFDLKNALSHLVSPSQILLSSSPPVEPPGVNAESVDLAGIEKQAFNLPTSEKENSDSGLANSRRISLRSAGFTSENSFESCKGIVNPQPTDVPAGVLVTLPCQNSALPKNTEDTYQNFKEQLNSEAKHGRSIFDLTSASSLILCKETTCSGVIEAVCSPSKSQTGINLIDDESNVTNSEKDPELTSSDLDSMLYEWKLSTPILPFSDDSCGFDDESSSVGNDKNFSALLNEETNALSRHHFQVNHESATICSSNTLVNLISVATNTEEIKLTSVALSPIPAFHDHFTFQMSQDSSVTLSSGRCGKESGILPIGCREDKAVSPIRQNYKDVGVMPIKELKTDVALSPLKTQTKSTGTSPVLCMFRDSAVSPISVKRVDAMCGSDVIDKSTQVNIIECPKEISSVLEEQSNLPKWSEESKLLHQILEKLGMNYKDLESVVSDKYLVEELKKTLHMALKSSCVPSSPKEYTKKSFCSFEPCEFAELCNQQHYNLHLLAKSKNLEKQMCKLGGAGKNKVKRLKRINQRRRKTPRFTEESFIEEKSQLCGIGMEDKNQQNLKVRNQTTSHSQTAEFIPTQTHNESSNTDTQSIVRNGVENSSCNLNTLKSVCNNPTATPCRSLDSVTAKNLDIFDGKEKLSPSIELSTTCGEGIFEMENIPNAGISGATLKTNLCKSSNDQVFGTTTSDSDKEVKFDEISNQVYEMNSADNNEDTSSSNVCSYSLRKNTQKRESSSCESVTTVKECETSGSKLVGPLRRSPRVKRRRVVHDFDSRSRNSYEKGSVKFVKGETVFVSGESEMPFVKERSSLAQEMESSSDLPNRKGSSHPCPVFCSSSGKQNVDTSERNSKADFCEGLTISHAFENQSKHSILINGGKRTTLDLQRRTESKSKRFKLSSHKTSSDAIDDSDDDKLIIACGTDNSEDDATSHSPTGYQSADCIARNVSLTDVRDRTFEDLNTTEFSENSRSEKLFETPLETSVSHCRSKAVFGKLTKLQRLRSFVSKVHPLAQATKASRVLEDTEVNPLINERMKKLQPILPSSCSKDEHSKLSMDVLEKYRGREMVRMAAATSGRTAQLIQPNCRKSVKQKATVARNKSALRPIKPVSKATSIQPLIRPEDRLLSTENSFPPKNRMDRLKPDENSALVVVKPLDPLGESNKKEEANQSSFLITDGIGFKVTTLSPIAYAVSDRHTSETRFQNKNALKSIEKFVEETLKKLVAATSFTPSVLQEAIDALSKPGLENVQAVIVRDVVKMMDDDYDTPPLRCGNQQLLAPPLTPVQQQLLTLVLQLSFQHEHLKQLPHQVLRLLEYRMFRLGKAPEGHRLQWCSRLYAAICRVLCLRSEALIFCWDALYTLRSRSYDVVNAVMDVWPYLFPINPNYEKACPNAQVMLHLLKCHVEKPSAEQNSRKVDKSWLKWMLRSSGLQSTSINSTLLSSMFFSNLIEGTLDTYVTAMVLLAKREEEQWTMKNVISGNFLPALEKWRSRSLSDAAGERVIWTMCSILRALPPERNGDTSHSVLKLLKSELLQKDHGLLLSSQMQEVLAIGLSLLSKHDIETVAHSLMSWNPSHGSSKGYSSRLLQYLSSMINSGSRPLSWWQSQLNQIPKSNLEE